LQAMKAWACIRSSVRRLTFPSCRTSLRCSVSTSCTVSHWNHFSCVLTSYNCVTKSVGRQAGRQHFLSICCHLIHHEL
jgi:hypothetical protein